MHASNSIHREQVIFRGVHVCVHTIIVDEKGDYKFEREHGAV